MDEAGFSGPQVSVPLKYKLSPELRGLLNKVAAESDIQPLEEIGAKELAEERTKEFEQARALRTPEEIARAEKHGLNEPVGKIGVIPDKEIRFLPNGYIKSPSLESSLTRDKSVDELNKMLGPSYVEYPVGRFSAIITINQRHNKKLMPIVKAFREKLKTIYETGSV